MAEEKTIIIKNEEEEKSNFTFKNYLHAVNIYKYWILGISLIVGIIGYLVTALGINKNTQKVSSTFNYFFSTTSYYSKEATLFTGEKININSIYSEDNIKQVYNNTLDSDGNKVFASLNLDDITSDAAFSLETAEVTYTRSASEPVSSDTFTLSANLKPFKNSALATKFVEELINLIPSRVVSSFGNYKLTNYLSSASSDSSSFIVLVETIKNQYNNIDSRYSSLISKYGKDQYVSSQSKTLEEVITTFRNEYTSNSSNLVFDLESVLEEKAYCNYTASQKDSKLAELEADKLSLEKEKADLTDTKTNLETIISSYQNVHIDVTNSTTNTTILSQFENYLAQFSSVNTRLAAIEKNITLIDKQKENVTNSTSDYLAECASYKTRIVEAINKLNSSTEQASKVVSSIALSNSSNSALFASSNKVEVTGSIPSVAIAAVGLVLGYVISSLIYAYYYVNFTLKEEENNKQVNKVKVSKEKAK